MRTTKRGKFAVIAVGLALVAAACSDDKDPTTTEAPVTTGGGDTTAAPAEGGTITYAAEQEFYTYNNGTSDGNAFANALVLNPVQPFTFYFDDKAALVMSTDLLDSAELTSTSPETVVYKIKADAVWSDGVAVDCKDFQLAWISSNGTLTQQGSDGTPVTDPDSGTPVLLFNTASTTGYENIKSVECADGGKTVTATYDKNFSDWNALFTGLIPAHVVEAKSGVADIAKAYADKNMADLAKAAEFWNTGFTADKGIDPTVMLSAGPFMITSFTPGESVVLEKNPKWWGTPALADSIVFRLIDDATQQPIALQNKEVQVITPQPNPDLLAQLEGVSGAEVKVDGGYTYEHMDFNFASPLTKQLPVRQAFALCLPRQEIVDKLIVPVNPSAVVVNNHFYFPFQSDYVDNAGDYAKVDIAKAKSTLEADGWALGSDGIYAKGGTRLSMKIARKDPNPRRASEVQLTAASCKEAGIEIIDQPNEDIFSNILPTGQYEIALFAWVGSPLQSSQKAIFTTGGSSNFGQYTNTKLDPYLDQLTTELDPAKLAAAADAADKLVWADVATIPIFQFPDLTATDGTVSGVIYNPTQAGITWNAQLWSLK